MLCAGFGHAAQKQSAGLFTNEPNRRDSSAQVYLYITKQPSNVTDLHFTGDYTLPVTSYYTSS